MPEPLTIGSFCTGYAGLDLAVEEVFGAITVWVCDIEAGPSAILAYHYPDVPNLGDLKTIDWDTLEPVDIICAGYPCQPFSHAGKRGGTDDPRHLWPYIAEAIRRIRPRYVVLENVAGHRTLGLDTVLAELAEDGYDAQWVSLRAADIGAPHGRERLFILAVDTHRGDSDGLSAAGLQRQTRPQVGRAASPDARGEAVRLGTRLCESGSGRLGRRRSDDDAGEAAPDAEREPVGLESVTESRGSHAAFAGDAGADIAADASSDRRRKGLTESAGQLGGHDADWRDPLASPDADLARSQGPEPTGRHLVPDRRVAADPDDDSAWTGLESGGSARGGTESAQLGAVATADADSDGLGSGRLGSEGRDVDRRDGEGQRPDWGIYQAAITRWENTIGRAAPTPVEPGPRSGLRLAPRFVEWMQGLDDGWVTDPAIWTGWKVGAARNAQLRALGNGVVRQQAREALYRLIYIATHH